MDVDMRRVKNLTGQRFGKLVALRCVGKDRHNNAVWLCRCDCGCEKEIVSRALVSGSSRSCGCLETGKFINGKPHRHGGSGERLYRVWGDMRNRCYDKNRKCYPSYGGRGIKVCDEWLHDYAAFREWAMRSGYDPNAPRGACTLDRIDNDGDYCPENCRWVSMDVQRWNKHDSWKLEYKGKVINLREASLVAGITENTIRCRIKRGWSVERAIEQPARRLSNGNASRVA